MLAGIFWKVIIFDPVVGPLCLMLNRSVFQVVPLNFMIFEPHIGLQTLFYADIRQIIDKFYINYIETSNRTFVFVLDDQQSWIQMWKLHIEHPSKYHWLIPVLGEWH